MEDKNSITQKLKEIFLNKNIYAVEHYPRTWEDSLGGEYFGISFSNIVYLEDKNALEILLPLLKDEKPVIRSYAAWGLGLYKYRVEDAIPYLLECLNDTGENVAYKTAYALGEIARKEEVVIPELLRIAQYHNDNMVRQAAVDAIGGFGENGKEAVEILLQMLENDNFYQVRAMAAKSLGLIKIKTDEVTSKLLYSAKFDKNSWVRTKSAEAIGELEIEEFEEHLVDDLLTNQKENFEKFGFVFAILRINRNNTQIREILEEMIQNKELSSYEMHQIEKFDIISDKNSVNQ